jgi:hypothetical protein
VLPWLKSNSLAVISMDWVQADTGNITRTSRRNPRFNEMLIVRIPKM